MCTRSRTLMRPWTRAAAVMLGVGLAIASHAAPVSSETRDLVAGVAHKVEAACREQVEDWTRLHPAERIEIKYAIDTTDGADFPKFGDLYDGACSFHWVCSDRSGDWYPYPAAGAWAEVVGPHAFGTAKSYAGVDTPERVLIVIGKRLLDGVVMKADGRTDQEFRLAMILGHELAHVAMGHIYDIAPFDPTVWHLLEQADEFEADAAGLRYATHAYGVPKETAWKHYHALWLRMREDETERGGDGELRQMEPVATGRGVATTQPDTQEDGKGPPPPALVFKEHPPITERVRAVVESGDVNKFWRADTHFRLGVQLLSLGDWDRAGDCFADALMGYPESAEILSNLAHSRMMKYYTEFMSEEHARQLGVLSCSAFVRHWEPPRMRGLEEEARKLYLIPSLTLYELALELSPRLAPALANYGSALLMYPATPPDALEDVVQKIQDSLKYCQAHPEEAGLAYCNDKRIVDGVASRLSSPVEASITLLDKAMEVGGNEDSRVFVDVTVNRALARAFGDPSQRLPLCREMDEVLKARGGTYPMAAALNLGLELAKSDVEEDRLRALQLLAAGLPPRFTGTAAPARDELLGMDPNIPLALDSLSALRQEFPGAPIQLPKHPGYWPPSVVRVGDQAIPILPPPVRSRWKAIDMGEKSTETTRGQGRKVKLHVYGYQCLRVYYVGEYCRAVVISEVDADAPGDGPRPEVRLRRRDDRDGMLGERTIAIGDSLAQAYAEYGTIPSIEGLDKVWFAGAQYVWHPVLCMGLQVTEPEGETGERITGMLVVPFAG